MKYSLSLICVLFVSCVLKAAPESALVKNGEALVPIITGEKPGKVTEAAARDLATYLNKISGAEFKIETGNGSKGIVLGTPAQFSSLPFEVKFDSTPFSREEYVIKSGKNALWLIGASELAVQHAVWDLLHSFGYRQFFPGENWEVVPKKKDLAVAIDVRKKPDFYARRIWYNWGFWGYNRQPYVEWSKKNRMARGFMLNSGHSYGAIIGRNRQAFKEHPEYFSLINGKRRTKGGTKFCTSNPDLRKLVVDDAVRMVKRKPGLDSISLDPSDGGNWCQCEPCKKMGSVSDRALILANDAAAAINKLGLGPKYVGMYAYNRHCPPPSIKVHPNVIISCTTGFLTGGFTFDQVVRGWQKQGATIGVYDYFSVIAWDWNLPRRARSARPKPLAAAIKKRHGMGARFYDCESGDAWGPYGLGYYVANRVMWDVDEAGKVDEIVDDFLTKAFGPAKAPMKAFYDLITVDNMRRSSADIVGRMYRSLKKARELAKDDPAIIKRIDDLTLYTRYVELFDKLASKGRKWKNPLLSYAYRMRKTMMIHAHGLWARKAGQKAARDKKNPLKNETPFTEEEILGFLENGIKNNQPVDLDFATVDYSKDLVPAKGRLSVPEVPAGRYAPVPQSRQIFNIWVAKAPAEIPLKVKTKKVWKKRMPKIILRSPKDVTITQVDENDSWGTDNTWHDIVLKTPHDGLHTIELLDGGDYSHVQWPEDMPVTLESAMDSKNANNYFRGAWTMYFYVPKGTRNVAGWANRIASWASRIKGVLKDADGTVHVDFSKRNNGWFNVKVPTGRDGTFWKFENSQGMRRMATVPPYFAVRPDLLLLPKEVVEKDGKK